MHPTLNLWLLELGRSIPTCNLRAHPSNILVAHLYKSTALGAPLVSIRFSETPTAFEKNECWPQTDGRWCQTSDPGIPLLRSLPSGPPGLIQPAPLDAAVRAVVDDARAKWGPLGHWPENISDDWNNFFDSQPSDSADVQSIFQRVLCMRQVDRVVPEPAAAADAHRLLVCPVTYLGYTAADKRRAEVAVMERRFGITSDDIYNEPPSRAQLEVYDFIVCLAPALAPADLVPKTYVLINLGSGSTYYVEFLQIRSIAAAPRSRVVGLQYFRQCATTGPTATYAPQLIIEPVPELAEQAQEYTRTEVVLCWRDTMRMIMPGEMYTIPSKQMALICLKLAWVLSGAAGKQPRRAAAHSDGDEKKKRRKASANPAEGAAAAAIAPKNPPAPVQLRRGRSKNN